MLPGTPARATHDYKRHGTSSLYAALNLTTGKVISALHGRHRAVEFKKFLQTIDREVPAHLDVHLVLDNSSTHKTPQIKRWLAAHPRFHLHFTPTSSSWLNLVERWFAELTNKLLKRGAHRSVRHLNADIRARTPSRSCGPRPPNRSSNRSPATANESINQDTRSSLPSTTASGQLVHGFERTSACDVETGMYMRSAVATP
jgi:transposase